MGKAKTLEERKADFIAKAKEIFGDDYIFDKVEYVNARTPVIVTCKKHGDFLKIPDVMVNRKSGCPMCSLGKIPKEPGYWNNLEHCLEEAKKYPSKAEFQMYCYGAFNAMKRNGWEDKLDTLYDLGKMYKDYNDKVHVVYVYEIPEFNACYVGRTNNIARRHRQHSRGYGHKNGQVDYDNLYKFCEEKGIKMPKPIILEHDLEGEESRAREKFYIDKYKDEGWNLINKATAGTGSGSLGKNLDWTFDKCQEVASKFDNPLDLKHNDYNAYCACVRHDWLDTLFPDYAKYDRSVDLSEGITEWTFDKCKEFSSQCSNKTEFKKRFPTAYQASITYGWLSQLIGPQKADITEEDELEMVKLYQANQAIVTDLMKMYKTSQGRVVEILNKHGVVLQRKKNPQYQINKYKRILPVLEPGYYYVAKSKKDGTIIPDYLDLNGMITDYMKRNYPDVHIPDKKEKDEYYENNRAYWYKDYFDIEPIYCPECDNIVLPETATPISRYAAKLILDEYKTGYLTLMTIALKYKISDKNLKEICQLNNVAVHSQGGSKKLGMERFDNPPVGFAYVAKAKDTGKMFSDYTNNNGTLGAYLNKRNITIPSVYERSKYFNEHGQNWFDQYFDYVLVPISKLRNL